MFSGLVFNTIDKCFVNWKIDFVYLDRNIANDACCELWLMTDRVDLLGGIEN